MSDGLNYLRADIRGSVADFPATVRCAILSSLLLRGPGAPGSPKPKQRTGTKSPTRSNIYGSMIAKTCCCF